MKRFIFFLLFLLFSFFFIAGCVLKSPLPQPPKNYEIDPDFDAVVSSILDDFSKNPPEPCTSSMVDFLSLTAWEDAKTATHADLHNAAVFLSKAFLDNPWKDSKTMEDIIYYGSLLDNVYKRSDETKVYASIGFNAVRTVKYVYHNEEETSDAITAYNKTISLMLDVGIVKRGA